MRKIIWLLLFCLLLSGCAKAEDSFLYDPPFDPKAPVELALAFDEPEKAEWVTLSEEDGKAVLSLLDQRFRKSGGALEGHLYLRNADALCYISIYEKDQILHEEGSLHLTLDETAELNALLERYLNIWWEKEPVGTPTSEVKIAQFTQTEADALPLSPSLRAELLQLLNEAKWQKDCPEYPTHTRLWIDGVPYFHSGYDEKAYILCHKPNCWAELEGEAARRVNEILCNNRPVENY